MERVFWMLTEHKFFFAWSEEKEMKYLQEQSQKGLHLNAVGLFKYYFDQEEAAQLQYAADFRTFDKLNEEQYLQLYEDAGWQFIDKFGGWYYFKNNDLTACFYNDLASVKAKYKRLLLFLLITALPLYYQMLILFPNLSASQGMGFYNVLKWIVYLIASLHFYGSMMMLRKYLKLKNNIKQ